MHSHSDMMLADNATQKLHYGHFTFYFKAVVKRHENIAIAKDLLADGVIGGFVSRQLARRAPRRASRPLAHLAAARRV